MLGTMLALSLCNIKIFDSQCCLPVLSLMVIVCSAGWAFIIGNVVCGSDTAYLIF